MLAKQAETLDRVSGGRFVLGLGAGGYDHEFSAFGLTVRTPGEKIRAQREAVAILRGLWSQPSTTLRGTEFSVTDARIEPRPAHPIPIWLGSYGPRALELTGQIADGWLPRSAASISRGRRRCGRPCATAVAAGRDPDAGEHRGLAEV